MSIFCISSATPGYGLGYFPDPYSLINIQTEPVKALKPRIKPTNKQPFAAPWFVSSLSWLLDIEFTMINERVPKIPKV